MKYSKGDIVELFDLLLEEMEYDIDDLINDKMYFEHYGYIKAFERVKKFRLSLRDL